MSHQVTPTRVLFCGHDGLFSGLVLRQLLDCPDLRVVACVRSTRVLRADYGFLRGAWCQVRRSGLAYALYLWVATTLTDLLFPDSIRRLSLSRRIPIHATRNLNDPAGVAFIAAAQPDVLVSAFFNQRIGAAVRALPRAAALNIHPSLLPEFKGVDPVFYARLRQAPTLGVTVHHLAESFDAGDCLLQQALPVQATDSLFRTTARLFALGGQLLAGRLDKGSDALTGTPQTGGRYDSWPTARQVRQFHRRGMTLMRSADLIWAARAAATRTPDGDRGRPC